MGACASTPATDGCSAAQKGTSPAAPGAGPGRAPAWPGDEAAGAPAPCGAAEAGCSAVRTLEMLAQVQELQQRMALASASPLLGLTEAAEMLADHLEADLVAIWTVCPDDPGCSVLLAAHGEGAALLWRNAVRRAAPHGSGGGDARLGAPCDLFVPDIEANKAAGMPVPGELALLHGLAGLACFAQVPLGVSGEPLGALLAARRSPPPCAAEGGWWQVRLRAASMGVLQHVRHPQVEQAACVVRLMEETDDPLALISVVLRSARRYVFRASSLRATVRLALLHGGPAAPSPSSSSAAAAAPPPPPGAGQALLFEVPRGPPPPGAPDAFRGRAAEPLDALGAVTSAPLALDNTLLAAAVARQQARFVSDLGQYMQACRTMARDLFTRSSDLVSSIVVIPMVAKQACRAMARDVFTRSSDLVSSIVVIPIVVDGRAIGGIYFALDAPCSFDNLRHPLLGYVHAVSRVLDSKLAGAGMAALVERANSVRRQISFTAGPLSVARSSETLGSSPDPDTGAGAGGPLWPSPLPRSRGGGSVGSISRSPSQQRFNTEAMLQVLQQEVRRSCRRAGERNYMRELVLNEQIGRGGFGTVFRGTWHKSVAAIKVMYVRKNEREAMKDAVEMAVLSTVQHPNIVQLYACLTNMVEVADEASMGSSCSSVTSNHVRYRRLAQDEDADDDAATCNILVLEFCDRGTLRDAVKAGAFHRPLPDGSVGINIAAAIEVLLDVACAVSYLHGMHLVHGDLKLDNVLLKSDMSRPRGVTPKLADFGLAKILNESEAAVNLDGAGTITHLAPEMFEAGSRVTTAVDSYAFGILMWELYTAKRCWAGLPREAVAERVYRLGGRPRFPAATPQLYTSLASDCLRADPRARPGFAAIRERLEVMAAAADAAAVAAAAAAAAARPRAA